MFSVNNATARVQTKKPQNALQSVLLARNGMVVQPTLDPEMFAAANASALRGLAAMQRPGGRLRPPSAAAAAALSAAAAYNPVAAALSRPALTAGATALTPGAAYPSMYAYDPATMLALQAQAAAAGGALQASQNAMASQLLKTPLSVAGQTAFVNANPTMAAATRAAYAGVSSAAAAAAAAQPSLAGYALGAYPPEAFLSSGIGPIPGYGATVYRGAYNRFSPY
ncbi:unnamed protein product [Notodromas monacha]|uniref:Uncharacterized protein n=1 Tax=Notodromas monacha TaxID=399045 RepID=A0A7R9BD73_9CRUS|nr:unnamed protein product [Notodromas monacha]CAG0913159.1 unnamed protein product [Notodromas monacha]